LGQRELGKEKATKSKAVLLILFRQKNKKNATTMAGFLLNRRLVQILLESWSIRFLLVYQDRSVLS
ncbi:MAG: hypothetical protein ACJATI_004767, partial [Halioglobus sp.]